MAVEKARDTSVKSQRFNKLAAQNSFIQGFGNFHQNMMGNNNQPGVMPPKTNNIGSKRGTSMGVGGNKTR